MSHTEVTTTTTQVTVTKEVTINYSLEEEIDTETLLFNHLFESLNARIMDITTPAPQPQSSNAALTEGVDVNSASGSASANRSR